MSEYELKPKYIPSNDDFDVIVAGGGPSGCAAAIAAAREGAKTLLIESTGSLGGMGTSGLVPAWCPFSDQEKIIYGGLAQRIFELSKAPAHIARDALDWVPIDPELLKRVYDGEVVKSGAKVLFFTFICDLEKRDGRNVDVILAANKAGLTAYRAKVFIDCTGDGDIAAWAGARIETGGENGDAQPGSLCFSIGNADIYGYLHGGALYGGDRSSKIYDILKSGRYPHITSTHLCCDIIGPGTVGFNAGHIWNADNTDPFALTEGIMEGRRAAASYRDALAEFYPAGFGNGFLTATGALMGVRESRRVVGDYVLTREDYLARRSFPDEICRNSYYIDVHMNKEDEERQHKGEIEIDGMGMRYGRGESHGVPYRCLTPAGLDNVLVAGRAISCERDVQGSVRVMPVCLCTGEAAGMAGAMAAGASDEVNAHGVDTGRLRRRLKEEGAYLP
ncbi:MAG: FAD-dependent oxidoreductase [Defluviitaleaceae bacterium]|nr:FAD-dependent oxidoreductase [Defluviitaleaceae bacterium]